MGDAHHLAKILLVLDPIQLHAEARELILLNVAVRHQ